MLDIVVTVTIATLSGVGVMSGKMWSRLHELDKRVDQVELRVAEQYVSKKDLEGCLIVWKHIWFASKTSLISSHLDKEIVTIFNEQIIR